MSAVLSMPPSVRARLWRLPEPDPAGPVQQLLPVLAVALLGGLTLHVEALGLAAPVTGAAVLAVAFRLRATPPTRDQLVLAAGAVLLLGVAAVRSAEWLVVLCVLGAWSLGTLSLVGGRTWTGVLVGSVAAALVPARVSRWFLLPLRQLGVPVEGLRRAALVGMVSLGLLVVFGSLFGEADPAYAKLLHGLVPSVRADVVVQRVVLLLGTLCVAAAAAYLGQRPPDVDALAPGTATPVRRSDWLVPLLLVDLLFASFVLVQLTVLFGDRSHVLRTTGLSYAEYARHGFWQLLVVTGLTLAVIAGAARWAPRVTAADRQLVRGLLGALCLLSLVVVASALHRMSLYQHEYGWTRLRLFVSAVELALGAVFVLLLAAGVRLDGSFLPRAVVGVAAGTLLLLAAMNPDAWIARHDVERYQATGKVDTAYLSHLSADAVPALLGLPADKRACAVGPIGERLRGLPTSWWDDSLGRHRARALLEGTELGSC